MAKVQRFYRVVGDKLMGHLVSVQMGNGWTLEGVISDVGEAILGLDETRYINPSQIAMVQHLPLQCNRCQVQQELDLMARLAGPQDQVRDRAEAAVLGDDVAQVEVNIDTSGSDVVMAEYPLEAEEVATG